MNALETALQWHNLGIATIPILARSKRPALQSWNRWQTELPSVEKLEFWFCTGYNIAVLTGWRGLAVVDFDSQDKWQSWQESHDVMDTYRVKTRRGWHLYFYVEAETTCYRGEGVDVKASGGYVLTPPSVHPSGHVYRAYGSPEQIGKIGSVKDILPEYEDVPAWQPKVRERKPVDPFDDAMREPVGLSVESIKANWQWPDIIPVNGRARRGVVMVNCPFHSDTHASMALYTDKHCHCFGCGYHSDIIDVYAELHNLTLQEALKEMANG